MNDVLINLIARLETATEGSPALSEDLLKALGWQWERMGCPGGGLWKNSQQGIHCGTPPDATENAEAARTLVPEGIFVAAQGTYNGHWVVEFYEHRPSEHADPTKAPAVTAEACTLALALCSAVAKWQLYANTDGFDSPKTSTPTR